MNCLLHVANFLLILRIEIMNLIIVTILILVYILISTEYLTNINKAAVAIFAAATGWVLYICYGTDFVMGEHAEEYKFFLQYCSETDSPVKHFIARNVFLPYVGKASEIALFLLATMTIVEILNNNGCFDFLRQLLRTRSSKRMLWTLAIVTFAVSANLDNLTTTVMMLTMMNGVIPNRRHRMVYGSVIMLAANCGGALTVIGNPEGLVLWNTGAVTATSYSLSMAVPCLVAWLLPTYMLSRMLPDRVETESIVMPYRGEDTRLNVWQRLVMLIVGIGGLWFIPTFHSITKLSPFLGVLCVLAILWIVNEIFNRKLMDIQPMGEKRVPHMLQYGVIQMMLYILGFMLAIGVVKETGAIDDALAYLHLDKAQTWMCGLMAGVASVVLDNFATAMTFFSFHDIGNVVFNGMPGSIMPGNAMTTGITDYAQNGLFWKMVTFCTMAGGNVLSVGNVSGLALMKMERIHLGWYFRNVGWKALLGALLGYACMILLS